MTTIYHLTNTILSILTILILLPLLFYSAFVNKGRAYRNRHLYAAIFSTAVSALSNLAYIYCVNYTPVDVNGSVSALSILFNAGLYLACFFITLYLSCHAGYEDRIKKHFLFLLIPVAAAILLIGSSSLFYSDMIALSSQIIILIYLAAAFFMLWKIDRTLVVLPAILFITMLYFNSVLYADTTEPLLLAIYIAYVYTSLTKRSILIHLGGIILTLFILTTLIIGNMITSSAFISYLKTIHDRNDSHLTDVIVYMDRYKALPWLMDYWVENSDTIVREMDKHPGKKYRNEFNVRLHEITSEDAETLPEDKQLYFASTCYKRIADFIETEGRTQKLDELFLIIPDDSYDALIIFDEKRNEDGTYRLGQFRNIEEDTKEWFNYYNAIDNSTAWTWGQYSIDDDFGFYRELSFGYDGNSAILCNSFDKEEVHEQLKFISYSRERAIRFFILAIVIILLFLYFSLLKPLTIISRAARKYQKDKDADAVAAEMKKIHLKNEIGTFADEFSSLAGEMNRYTTEVASLAGEKEKVSTELRMASSIQHSALPNVFPAFPDRKDFDIYADMKPAKEVGGDFYDFFLIDENHLAFIIADVSDKGVPASLFMMSAKNLINYRTHEGGTPGEILTSVNSHLCQNNDSMMFVTVWLGILDLKTGMLISASAGHEPPAINTADGTYALYYDDDHGLAMGVIQDSVYTDYSMQLSPGDTVFIYTDGVTEARDVSDDLYGDERLLSCLNRAGNDDPADIIARVKEDIDGFSKGAVQSDDITMLAVTYLGVKESRPR